MRIKRGLLFILLLAMLAGCGVMRSAAPQTPEGLDVTPVSDSSALVSWGECEGADGYEVQYYSAAANTWAEDDSYHSGTSFVSDRWADSLSGLYRVRAVNASGSSDWATVTTTAVRQGADLPAIASDQGQDSQEPPAAPTAAALPGEPENISATEADVNKALISWTAGRDADSYDVEYYSRKYNEWRADSDYVSGTSYVSTGLDDYESFQYRVRSVNGSGCSDWVIVTFEKRTIAPAKPTNLRAEKVSSGSAMLTWDASAGATGYEVQYFSRKDNAWYADTSYSGGTSYKSNGLEVYDWFEFRVRAVNAAGKSDWVNYTYWSTYSAPERPTGLRAETADLNAARLSWNAVEHISYYEVQYYSPSRGTWVTDTGYTSPTSTSFVSHGLDYYDSYDFRVRAVNEFGASSWVTVTYVKPAPPDMPTGLWAERSAVGEAVISWNGVAGANHYEVQYYSRRDGLWQTDGDYSGGTSYVSTGLDLYDSYEFRVRAVNSAGAASAWAEITYYNPDYAFDYDVG